MGEKNIKANIKVGFLIIGLAIAIIGSGALYSYLSDAQTSGTNTFTSGTLILQVGSAIPCTDYFSSSNLVPGNQATVAGWQMQNVGGVPGNLSIKIDTIANQENIRNAAEIAAGDPDDGTTTNGELGANLMTAFWIDMTNNGTSGDDLYLNSTDGKVYSMRGITIPGGANATLNSYSGRTWSDIVNYKGNGNIGYFKVTYSLPGSTTSVIQSDSCVFSIIFMLNQSLY
jgi:hypothetical protein